MSIKRIMTLVEASNARGNVKAMKTLGFHGLARKLERYLDFQDSLEYASSFYDRPLHIQKKLNKGNGLVMKANAIMWAHRDKKVLS